VVGISQDWKLSGAIKTAERKLADRTLLLGGQALMAWAVSIQRGCLDVGKSSFSQPSIFVI
jgi:hypothetical protein